MHKNTPESFWANVDKSRGPDACWPWTKGKARHGYGKATYQGRTVTAHRLAWELVNGPIPEGKYICHSCDNPPCCNPAHLWLGTAMDNQADAKAKGHTASGDRSPARTRQGSYPHGDAHWTRKEPERAKATVWSKLRPEHKARGERSYIHQHPEIAQGERNGHSKLTEAKVREIRERFATGDVSQAQLARDYGVPQTQISRIVLRTAWRHVK